MLRDGKETGGVQGLGCGQWGAQGLLTGARPLWGVTKHAGISVGDNVIL